MTRPRTDVDAHAVHLAAVRALARAMVDDDALVDDVTQDAYVLALERGVDLRDPSAVSESGIRRWFVRTIRLLNWKASRAKRSRREREVRASRPEVVRDGRGTDELATELSVELDAALLQLDETYRSTIVRVHYEGRSTREVAEEDGVSLDVVHQRLSRGRRALRRKLGGRGRRAVIVLAGLRHDSRPAPAPAPRSGRSRRVIASKANALVACGLGVVATVTVPLWSGAAWRPSPRAQLASHHERPDLARSPRASVLLRKSAAARRGRRLLRRRAQERSAGHSLDRSRGSPVR